MFSLSLGCYMAWGMHSWAFWLRFSTPGLQGFLQGPPSVACLHFSSVVKTIKRPVTYYTWIFCGYFCLNSNRSILRASSSMVCEILNPCNNQVHIRWSVYPPSGSVYSKVNMSWLTEASRKHRKLVFFFFKIQDKMDFFLRKQQVEKDGRVW